MHKVASEANMLSRPTSSFSLQVTVGHGIQLYKSKSQLFAFIYLFIFLDFRELEDSNVCVLNTCMSLTVAAC